MNASARTAYLVLSLAQARLGSSLVTRLKGMPPETVLELSVGELAGRLGLSERASRVIRDLRRTLDPDELCGTLSEKGIAVLTLADECYPERLKEVPDPPPALFLDGDLPGPLRLR